MTELPLDAEPAVSLESPAAQGVQGV
ncbi:hypothetical protein Ga0074812_14856, partial [Parafrankia irregularis]